MGIERMTETLHVADFGDMCRTLADEAHKKGLPVAVVVKAALETYFEKMNPESAGVAKIAGTVTAIMESNAKATEWFDREAITGAGVFAKSGSNQGSIRKWLNENAEIIDAHHHLMGIDDPANHNRRAAQHKRHPVAGQAKHEQPTIAVRDMQELVLIRGIPGSGKTTLAKNLEGYKHVEADMYFVKDGEYRFDYKGLRAAHSWCQDEAKKALDAGNSVVVANTFVKHWEMNAYLKMAEGLSIPVRVFIARGNYKNTHGVPNAVVGTMRQEFEA